MAPNVIIEMKEIGPGPSWVQDKEAAATPTFRLYEDGTVVRKETDLGHGTTRFWIGFLNKSDIRKLLNFIEKQGFFKMKEYYPSSYLDVGTIVITVNTGTQSKTVKAEYPEPTNFRKIFEKLETFNVPNAKKYRPPKATLFVYSLPFITDPTQYNVWPIRSIDLEQVKRVKKSVIRGDNLDQVLLVMQNRLTGIFSYQGKAYGIALKIYFPYE